jgi:uncharacterized membrane protein YhaH (DUF805 family)
MRLIEWLSRREVYAVAGVLLALVKYLIDRSVAARYGVQWLPWHYWVLPHEGSLLQVPDALRPMYLTLLWTSAPFALVGLTLTYLRLRAARLHGGWMLLFFVPLLNVMLFLSLCLLPSRVQEEGASAGVRGWRRFVPRDERGSWWAGALLPAPIGVAFCLLGVYGFQQYGWGLFVGAPFAVGLLAPVIAGAHALRTRGESLAVAGTALLMWGAGLLLPQSLLGERHRNAGRRAI